MKASWLVCYHNTLMPPGACRTARPCSISPAGRQPVGAHGKGFDRSRTQSDRDQQGLPRALYDELGRGVETTHNLFAARNVLIADVQGSLILSLLYKSTVAPALASLLRVSAARLRSA